MDEGEGVAFSIEDCDILNESVFGEHFKEMLFDSILG